MLVKDWMTENPRAVSSRTRIIEAMQILRKEAYRRLPVVDEGRLVGIVTDKDLREASPPNATSLSIYELNYLVSKLRVDDVMHKALYTITPDTPVEEAALLMEEKKVSGLPVVVDASVDDGELCGIFTITDMLRAFVTVLGLREGGTRVSVYMPDEPGLLAQVAGAAAPSNIVAVTTAGVHEGKRKMVLRVVGEGAENYPERLADKNIEVVDVH
ncbi:MAG: CBS domain-containing protein [Deinococcota bacterium]